jgi:hypothetical protein
MEIRAEIIGGICGLVTVVKAVSTDGMHVSLSVESDCKMIQAMAAEMPALNAFDEVLRKPLTETTPAQLAGRYKLHTTCLVPVGILKAIEAAAGLALPSSSGIELRREE